MGANKVNDWYTIASCCNCQTFLCIGFDA